MSTRISIIINSLVQGGAQKSALLLAEELHARGFEIQIVTFYPASTDFFSIPAGVEVTRLIYPFQDNGRLKGENKLLRKIERIGFRIVDFKTLRNIFIKFSPDVIIAFEAPTSLIAFMARQKSCPVIASERIHPKFHPVPTWVKILRPIIYRSKFVYLHGQGTLIADWMNQNYKKSVSVIPNFIGESRKIKWNSNSKKIKVFSRYCEQKGIDIAIEAWSLLPEDTRSHHQLEFFGDGDRLQYQKIVEDFDLENSVVLNPATKEIHDELGDCLIFMLPSRFEGFPNSLFEAIDFGIPSLATDSPSAIRDLTLNGKLAILAEVNPLSLSNKLLEMIENRELLQKLSDNGPTVRVSFDRDQIAKKWIKLINLSINTSRN